VQEWRRKEARDEASGSTGAVPEGCDGGWRYGGACRAAARALGWLGGGPMQCDVRTKSTSKRPCIAALKALGLCALGPGN
jgi:hypothetical protein